MGNNKCIVCGKEDYEVNTKKFPSKFCSSGCYEKWRRDHEEPNCECVICHKPMYLKPYRLKRVINGITCSKECANKLKEQYMLGEKNHQFGLKGDKNASFKEKEIFNSAGYIMEYAPDHPYADKHGRVLQHRLVIERNSDRFDEKFFTEVGDSKYLKPEYCVHHINENITDNRIENLQVLTNGEHRKLHNSLKEIIRDPVNGRIVGVKKLDDNDGSSGMQ